MWVCPTTTTTTVHVISTSYLYAHCVVRSKNFRLWGDCDNKKVLKAEEKIHPRFEFGNVFEFLRIAFLDFVGNVLSDRLLSINRISSALKTRLIPTLQRKRNNDIRCHVRHIRRRRMRIFFKIKIWLLTLKTGFFLRKSFYNERTNGFKNSFPQSILQIIADNIQKTLRRIFFRKIRGAVVKFALRFAFY